MPSEPRLAVLAVLLHQGEALLVRRRNPPDAMLWGWPGGKVEPGEAGEAAAARELHEETGLRAKVGARLGAHEYLSQDAAGRTLHHYLLEAWACHLPEDLPRPQPQAGDDAAEAAWVPFDQVLARALPMSEKVDELLRMALARA